MRIIVATLTGKRVVVKDIQQNDNFELLASVLYEKEGIPENQQRFIFAGKEIEQARTFQNYNIQNDSVIHLVLRLGGRHEFPSISMVCHEGIQIYPPFRIPHHDCTKKPYQENYSQVYKSEKPLYYKRPMIIKFNLSKLCVPRKCYPEGEYTKRKGGGFIIDKSAVGEYRQKKFGRIEIFELVHGKFFTDSYSKMVRNRKLVLEMDLGIITDPHMKKKDVITMKFFPRGKNQWKENGLYMCFLKNSEGGFRWIFSTTTVTVFEKEDDLERMRFLAENVFGCIKLCNKTVSNFGLMEK